MRFVLVTVIISVILYDAVHCENVENKKIENVEPDKAVSSGSVKTKRGILHYGYGNGLSYSLPPAYASHGYHKNWIVSPYSKIPGLYKNLASPGSIYALTHGGATVHSYNINYPKYNFVSRPAIIPSVAPLAPAPSVFIPSKPIVPISYPTFSHRVPFVVQKPFLVQRPVPSVPLSFGSVPSFGQAPLSPIAPVVPTTSFASIPQYPHIHPIVSPNYNPLPIGGIQPQLIPAQIPAPQPVIPTTLATPSNVLPQGGIGSNVFANVQPDGWRPIIVNQPSPVLPTATTTINRPSINLLPPYLSSTSAGSGTGQSEIQPTFEVPKQPNNFYLTPTESANLDQPQQQFTNEELAQAQGKFLLI